MGSLWLAADASVPFDYSTLPAGVHAIAGYVGGDTYYVWSDAEIAAAERAVGMWWAIWTAPNAAGDSLSAWQGQHDAAGMVAALRARSYSQDRPVFYDIERHVWDASPSGARAGIAAWATAMRSAGWSLAYPYAPPDYGSGWIYDWTNARPDSLPSGWVGQQYTGQRNTGGGPYDLSVFDESLWEDDMTPDQCETVVAQQLARYFAGEDGKQAQVRTIVRQEVDAALTAAGIATHDQVLAAVGNVIHNHDGKHPNAQDETGPLIRSLAAKASA